jgi:glycosyltransferase involved in cell wall biosynthesis
LERIVFVSHSGEKGGAPVVLIRLFRQALKEGNEEVYLVFRFPGELAKACQREFGEEKVFIVCNKNPREISGFKKPFIKVIDLFRLIRLFKKIKPRIVIANSLVNTTAVVAGLGAGARVVVWAHEVPGMIHDPLGMRSFWIRKAWISAGVSKEVCSYLKMMGVPPAKIRLLHHGLDLDEQFRETRVKTSRVPNGVLRLGALAVWSPRKRLDLIIETAIEIARSGKFKEVQLDIGGPVDLWFPALFEETMKRYFARPSCLEVRFLGVIEAIDPFYQDLDALLITSDREALPTVVLEALVRLIPVFSFEDLPGVQEILGKTALLARDRTGSALAEKVVQFFTNPAFPETYEQWLKDALARSGKFTVKKQWETFKEVFYKIG